MIEAYRDREVYTQQYQDSCYKRAIAALAKTETKPVNEEQPPF